MEPHPSYKPLPNYYKSFAPLLLNESKISSRLTENFEKGENLRCVKQNEYGSLASDVFKEVVRQERLDPAFDLDINGQQRLNYMNIRYTDEDLYTRKLFHEKKFQRELLHGLDQETPDGCEKLFNKNACTNNFQMNNFANHKKCPSLIPKTSPKFLLCDTRRADRTRPYSPAQFYGRQKLNVTNEANAKIPTLSDVFKSTKPKTSSSRRLTYPGSVKSEYIDGSTGMSRNSSMASPQKCHTNDPRHEKQKVVEKETGGVAQSDDANLGKLQPQSNTWYETEGLRDKEASAESHLSSRSKMVEVLFPASNGQHVSYPVDDCDDDDKDFQDLLYEADGYTGLEDAVEDSKWETIQKLYDEIDDTASNENSSDDKVSRITISEALLNSHTFKDYLCKIKESNDKGLSGFSVNAVDNDLSAILDVDCHSLFSAMASDQSAYSSEMTPKDSAQISFASNNFASNLDIDLPENPSGSRSIQVLFPVKSFTGSNFSISNQLFDIEDCSKTNQFDENNGNTVEKFRVSSRNTITVSKQFSIKDFKYQSNLSGLENVDSVSIDPLLSKSDEEDKTNDKSQIKEDLKIMFDSDEFKQEVLKIIKRYLKGAYMKDKNFEVIIVPKQGHLLGNERISEVMLKGFESAEEQTDCELATRSVENPFSELKNLNPRNCKGYTCKYDRRYSTNCCEGFSRKLSWKKFASYSGSPDKLIKTNSSLCKQLHHKEHCSNKSGSAPMFRVRKLNMQNRKESICTMRKRTLVGTELHIGKGPASLNSLDRILTPDSIAEDILKERTCKYDPNGRGEALAFQQPNMFMEFGGFKQAFNKVEVAHDSIFYTTECDPCGLLFFSESKNLDD